MSSRCKACRQIKSAEEDLKIAQSKMAEQSQEIVHVKKQVDAAYGRINAQKKQVNDAFKELNLVHTSLATKSMSVTSLREFIKDLRDVALKQENKDLYKECNDVLEKWR